MGYGSGGLSYIGQSLHLTDAEALRNQGGSGPGLWLSSCKERRQGQQHSLPDQGAEQIRICDQPKGAPLPSFLFTG